MTVADKAGEIIERQLRQLDEREVILRSIQPLLQRQREMWTQRNIAAEERLKAERTHDNIQRVYIPNLQLQITHSFIQMVNAEIREVEDSRNQLETDRVVIRLIGQKTDELSQSVRDEMLAKLTEQSVRSDKNHEETMAQLEATKKRVSDMDAELSER